jgi:diaminohydroxyphosphoribosylaminopyrimidine deaminase/5-amino-6-(5-phosphoribosylamino)uracil reductase
MAEEKFMQLALKLAERGTGQVSPNPLVGCVIVRNGRIVGKGWHERYGSEHAEVNALKRAGKNAGGATMYVTVEPCVHFGKQSPCADAVIAAGIREVVIAMRDVNPIVSGKGIKKLKKAGIKVRVGLLQEEAEKLNESFICFMTKKRPFIILKNAITLDGKITWGDGRRKRISGRESMRLVHQLRAEADAILVGINTVLKDDPRLTARMRGAKNPVRIILDSALKIPSCSKLLKQKGKTLIVCGKKASSEKKKALEKLGAQVLVLNEKNGFIDLKQLLKELWKQGIAILLVEGGAAVSKSFVEQKFVDKLMLFVSPRIVGEGVPFLPQDLLQKIRLRRVTIEPVGKDFLVQGYL